MTRKNNRRNKKGWPNEPTRHSMASQGIKTTTKGMKAKAQYLKTREKLDKYDITMDEIDEKSREWLDDPKNLLDLADALGSNLHVRVYYWPEKDKFSISRTASGNWSDQPKTANQYIELYRSDHVWDFPSDDTISHLDYILNHEREDLKEKYGDTFTSEFDDYRNKIRKANPHTRTDDDWKDHFDELMDNEEFRKKMYDYDVKADFVVGKDLGEIETFSDLFESTLR